MSKGEKRPSWFKLFLHQKPIIDSVPDEVVGKAVKAAFHYFATKEETELDALSMVVYSSFKPYIEESFTDYERDVRNGHKGGRPQKPPVTPGKAGLPSPTQADADAVAEAEKEEGNKAGKPPTNRRFLPPTVDEVKRYCQEQGYAVDAERFVDHYESNGWMVGKNKMKDWKASVRNWSRKEKANNGKIELQPVWSNIGTTI